ncbi:MAG: leucine-rich repeat domain-containing protein [Prevotella sp.]|nr:leucine-rich repeat domain-containing protein [Prevotella sp.]
MKKLLSTLMVVLSSITTAIRADDISIPTDADHPFSLNLATFEGNGLRINNENEIDNGRNGYKATFTLDNREDADYYLLSFKAGTQLDNTRFLITITADDGTEVLSSDVPLVNNGTWTCNYGYSVKTGKMEKGRYTLVFDFVSTGNEYAARLADIAFKKPMSLQPGDEVELVNPEFDNGYIGWEYEGNVWGKGSSSMFGNNCARMWEPRLLRQSVTSLPAGTYLMQVCAYHADDWDGTGELGSYVFLNDTYQQMKHVSDEGVGYRNIYRVFDGQSINNNYRHSNDGRFAPTHNSEWNEALAMAEHFYVNSIVAPVTNGMATIGLLVSRFTMLPCDHFRLVYLSDRSDVSAKECAALAREQTTMVYRERLNSQLSILDSLLTNGKPHAPQAVAEAKSLTAAVSDASPSDTPALIDVILNAEHLLQRLKLPFYELNGENLADQLATLGIQPTDTIALKLNGSLTADDFAALKTLTNLTELDLSEATLTALPDKQFEGKKHLTWLTLPDGLQSIGSDAFSDCYCLLNISLPSSLKTIGSGTFRRCYNLSHAVIPDNVSVGSYTFSESGIRFLSLPPTMKNIPDNLCSGCRDLTDIRFNGQAVIGGSAFAGCSSLQTLSLPEGLKWLDRDCFRSCTALTSVTLPSTLQYMDVPFNDCKNLTEITSLSISTPHSVVHEEGNTLKGCTLRVPQLAVAAYQEARYWREFAAIEGIDVLPTTLSIVSPVTLNMAGSLPADYKPDVSLGLITNDYNDMMAGAELTVEGAALLSARHYTQCYDGYTSRAAAWASSNGISCNRFYTSLLNNGLMRADTVTIDLRLYPNQWDYVSFPFDVRVADIDILMNDRQRSFGSAPLAIYGHDGAKRAAGRYDEAWVPMTADSILHAGRGYIWQSRLDLKPVNGDLLHSRLLVHAMQNATKPLFFRRDNVEVPLQRYYSEFANNRSWNFIGNPYPCFFDISNIDTTSPIIVWEFVDDKTSRYAAYSPLDDVYTLHPGQAFFIQCPLEQQSIVFYAEGRRNTLDVSLMARARAAKRAADQSRQVFNLELKAPSSVPGGTTIDRTRFVVNEAATLDYEQGRDAAKFSNPGGTDLYTNRDGIRYAIDERPLADGLVSLGFSVPAAGVYTLALASVPAASSQSEASQGPSAPAGTIALIDHETGTETLLTEEGYTFQAEAGTHDSRFTLRLNNGTDGLAEIVNSKSVNSKYYDLYGRPVTTPRPGLYIRDNKKVIIK